MTPQDINRLSPAERQRLAARVRLQASRGDELTDADLDVMQEQIEQGQVDRILAHYVNQMEMRDDAAYWASLPERRFVAQESSY